MLAPLSDESDVSDTDAPTRPVPATPELAPPSPPHTVTSDDDESEADDAKTEADDDSTTLTKSPARDQSNTRAWIDEELNAPISDEIQGVERDRVLFRREQLTDPHLFSLWNDLYHRSAENITLDEFNRLSTPHPTHSKKLRLIVPQSRVGEVLVSAHNTGEAAHVGANATIRTLKESFWWRSMATDARRHVRKCLICQAFRQPQPLDQSGTLPYDAGRFQNVYIDVLHMPLSRQGAEMALLIVDMKTGWPEVVPLTDRKAPTLVRAFDSVWRPTFGVPVTLHYDNAREHLGNHFQAYLQRHNITGHPIVPRNHRANLAERHIRSVKDRLARLTAGNTAKWQDRLPDVLFSLRQTESQTRGYSPFQLTFGFKPASSAERRYAVFHDEQLPDNGADAVASVEQRITACLTKADAHKAEQRERQLKRAAREGQARNFQVGAFVNTFNNDNEQSTKFANKQRSFGPYRIVGVDTRRLRVHLERVADGVTRTFWTSMHNAIPIDGDPTQAEPAHGVPDAVVFEGAADTRLLSEAQRAGVNRTRRKAVEQQQLEEAAVLQRAQRELEVQELERQRTAQFAAYTAKLDAPRRSRRVSNRATSSTPTVALPTPKPVAAQAPLLPPPPRTNVESALYTPNVRPTNWPTRNNQQ